MGVQPQFTPWPSRLCAAFLLDNSGPASRWDQLLLFYNASDRIRPAALPEGRWQLLADEGRSTCWQDQSPVLLDGLAELPASGALILGRTSLD